MIVEDILAQANALSPKKRRLFIRLVIETRDRPRLSAILAYGRRRSWATTLSDCSRLFGRFVLRSENQVMPIERLYSGARLLTPADRDRLIDALTGGTEPSL